MRAGRTVGLAAASTAAAVIVLTGCQPERSEVSSDDVCARLDALSTWIDDPDAEYTAAYRRELDARVANLVDTSLALASAGDTTFEGLAMQLQAARERSDPVQEAQAYIGFSEACGEEVPYD